VTLAIAVKCFTNDQFFGPSLVRLVLID